MLRVLDVETGQDVDGPIDRCRYSGVAWLPGGKAFYYTRRLAPGDVPAGEEQYHRRIYLHRVGTPADDDTMIFGAGREKTNYYMASVSMDGRWLIVGASAGTAPRNDLWLADLAASGGNSAGPARRPARAWTRRPWPGVGRDGRLYIFTDAGAPRGRLLVADPADPGAANWREKLPQDEEAVLTDYAILDGAGAWPARAAGGLDPARGKRDQRARPGHRRAAGAIPLPGLGTVGGLSERPGGRARGMVRLHRQRHAGDDLPLRRPQRGGRDLGPRPRRGRRS